MYSAGYMVYGQPEDDGKGIKYNGAKFGPVKDGGPDTCDVDTLYNSNIFKAYVQHAFTGEGSPGDELAIGFYGSGSMTIWIYEWN